MFVLGFTHYKPLARFKAYKYVMFKKKNFNFGIRVRLCNNRNKSRLMEQSLVAILWGFRKNPLKVINNLS